MRITLNSFSRFLSADSRCFKGKNFKQAPISIGKPVFTRRGRFGRSSVRWKPRRLKTARRRSSVPGCGAGEQFFFLFLAKGKRRQE